MCLVIDIPAKCNVPKKLLREAYYSNPNGFGIMWHDSQNQKLEFVKSVSSYKHLLVENRNLIEYARTIHLRYATHGEVDLENCHPFICGESPSNDIVWGMVHNGVVTIARYDDTKSDTWHLAKKLYPLFGQYPDLPLSPVFQSMLAQYVGSNNKLVLRDNRGNRVIINEFAGQWSKCKTIWFSNTWQAKVKAYCGLDDFKPIVGYAAQDSLWNVPERYKPKRQVTAYHWDKSGNMVSNYEYES